MKDKLITKKFVDYFIKSRGYAIIFSEKIENLV